MDSNRERHSHGKLASTEFERQVGIAQNEVEAGYEDQILFGSGGNVLRYQEVRPNTSEEEPRAISEPFTDIHIPQQYQGNTPFQPQNMGGGNPTG